MESLYRFRPMVELDFPMVCRWLKTPAVRRWWGCGFALLEQAFADPRIAMWIVSHGGRPFAYIQDYSPHDWAGHHFSFLPPGSRGIDQFIGEPTMIGRGHGAALIRAHVDGLFDCGAPAVGTDPDPANARAIRACEKAGFAAHGVHETPWGRSLVMTRFRS